jgi:hypothetical protein
MERLSVGVYGMERLSVGVYGEDDVFRRGLVAVLNDADCDCIVFGSEREISPESGGRGLTLDVAVVSSRSLAEVELSCPIVLLTTSELAPQETHQASTNVMATLLREGLTSEQLVASVRAAAAGLQVESSSLSRRDPTGTGSTPASSMRCCRRPSTTPRSTQTTRWRPTTDG